MAVSFSVQFRVNEKTGSRVIRLTDTSTGIAFGKGRFIISFPDYSNRGDLATNNWDITTSGGYIDIPAVTNIKGDVILGAYSITYIVADSSNVELGRLKRDFTFDWIKPSNGITNRSDSILPQVQFFDEATYTSSGNFTGVATRTFSTTFPSTSEIPNQPINTTTNTLTVASSGKYYEGIYVVNNDISVNYTNINNSYLSVYFTQLFSATFDIRKSPSQLQLIEEINKYRDFIDDLKLVNDARFEQMSEQYDLVISLYSHLVSRFEVGLSDGSQAVLEELMSILKPYDINYVYQSTQMQTFSLGINVDIQFSVSNGTTSTLINSGETLNLLSGNASLTFSVTDNTLTLNPIFGTSANTFAQGNDSRFHNAVTLGTSNGLSLASQQLSLALATSVSAGALSGDDKAKLDSFNNLDVVKWNTAYGWGNHALAGYLTTINNSQVVSALGYTPYPTTNPSGYISSISNVDVFNALGYSPYPDSNPNGYIDVIDSLDVINALGFTPYNITNPNGFINGIDYSMIVAALGFVPYSANNPNGYINSLSNQSVVNALGYLPVNPERVLTINGISYDLSEDRIWEITVAAELNLDTSAFGDDVSYDIETSTLNIAKYDWMDLVRGYSVKPTLFATIATGKVYQYVYSTSTFYRFIATDKSLDAFYAESALTTELCRKNIIV
jgi:hypothetical protein